MTQPIAHGTRRHTPCCWPDCPALADHTDVPLCDQHLQTVGLAWFRDNIDHVRAAVHAVPLDSMVDQLVADARARQPERDAAALAARVEAEARSVVYYLLVSPGTVKIGYTTDLGQRMIGLRADLSQVLATEPGGRDLEQARHRQFAAERHGRREDFTLSNRVEAHIRALRPFP